MSTTEAGADELETYRALVRQRLAARQAYWDRDTVRGVQWSGMGHRAPRPEMSEVEIEEAAHAMRDRQLAFRTSPRGLFLAALKGINVGAGFEPEVERVLGCYSRGFSTVGEAPVMSEIGLALEILLAINTRDAQAAMSQLAVILRENPHPAELTAKTPDELGALAPVLPLANRGA